MPDLQGSCERNGDVGERRDMLDQGWKGHGLGNYPRYYDFHPAQERTALVVPMLEKLLEKFQASRFLDIGCNSGDLTRRLHHAVRAASSFDGSRAETLGVDVDPSLIARARAVCCEGCNFATADVLQGDDVERALAEHLSPGRGRADVVFCFSVTMWVHLNHGEPWSLLRRLAELANVALVLEPQRWRSYKHAKRRLKKMGVALPQSFKDATAKPMPDIENRMRSFLLCRQACGQAAFDECHDLGLAGSWQRSILVFTRNSSRHTIGFSVDSSKATLQRAQPRFIRIGPAGDTGVRSSQSQQEAFVGTAERLRSLACAHNRRILSRHTALEPSAGLQSTTSAAPPPIPNAQNEVLISEEMFRTSNEAHATVTVCRGEVAAVRSLGKALKFVHLQLDLAEHNGVEGVCPEICFNRVDFDAFQRAQGRRGRGDHIEVGVVRESGKRIRPASAARADEPVWKALHWLRTKARLVHTPAPLTQSPKGAGRLCRNWLKHGTCNVKNCASRHYFACKDEANRAELMRAGRSERMARSDREQRIYESVGVGGSADCVGHGGKVHKRLRARLFAQWLLTMFGADELREGCGVLDVAGGKGALSVELLMQCPTGLRATVVDPYLRRCGGITKKDRRKLRKASRDPPSFVSMEFRYGRENGCVLSELLRADSVGSYEDEEMDEQTRYQAKLVQSCSVLLGLHPDQASGAIVDAAIASQKPFAIVPCCVFSSEFPGRRIRVHGKSKAVESLNDLVTWLLGKHPRIRVGLLAFEGRNKVLWMRKEDYV